MFLGSLIEALAYFQNFNLNISEVVLVGGAGILANALVQWKVTSAATARELGIFSATVKTHEKEIDSLKESRSEIWEKINSHNGDIRELQTKCELNHKKAHHG